LLAQHEIKDEDLEKLVKAHSELNLNTPMPGCTSSQFRQLLFEGHLTLKEHTKSKVTKVRKIPQFFLKK